MRIPILAVRRNDVDSSIEVDRVDTVAAVDRVEARVIVRLDQVVAGSSAHRVCAAVVGADQVSTVSAVHSVVADIAPDLVRATVA